LEFAFPAVADRAGGLVVHYQREAVRLGQQDFRDRF
jgi:hypothetical protein